MCCLEVQRKQHGDVVALLSEDGREVEILEILMQALLANWLAFTTEASEKEGLHAAFNQRPLLQL